MRGAVSMDLITLSFQGRGPGLAVIQAHTGLGAVYVGRLVRQSPRPGVARGWAAELWAAPGSEDDSDAEAPRLYAERLRDLERHVRERVARSGPWWLEADRSRFCDIVEYVDRPDPECICPPGLVERGGFRSGCPVHSRWEP